jgi:hypothetical protein
MHFNVTQYPTQAWLSRQLTEAFPWDTAPRYLLRDRDASYGLAFRNRVRAMGGEEISVYGPDRLSCGGDSVMAANGANPS